MKFATVKELADWFNKLVADGKGDYRVNVDDNMGGDYDLYDLFNGDRYGAVFDEYKTVSIGDFNDYGK